MANALLEPIDLSLALMKELVAKWLTEMAEYLRANPQFVINGFICSGIIRALDHNDESNVAKSGITYDEDEKDSDYQEDSDEDDDRNDKEKYPDDADEPSGSVGHLDKIIILQ